MRKLNLGTLKETKKSWQEAIIDQISHRKALPFVSNEISNDLFLGSHQEVLQYWADYIEYPLSRDTLTRMTQFQSVMSKADPEIRANDIYIKEVYLDFLNKLLFSIADETLVAELKEDTEFNRMSFSDRAARLNTPSFDNGQDNTLLLLADLPMSIYVTTSYHTFLEIALQRASKLPRTEICYWHDGLRDIPSVFESPSLLNSDQQYRPSEEEPLVYHLLGIDAHPSSLILTEDDHLDFLVTISENRDMIPLDVQRALGNSSLLLLGYKLQNWDFRVLFRGIIKPTATKRRPRSVCIQLTDNEWERNYVENYLIHEAHFEVHWGTTQAFVQELWQGWAE